MNIETQEMLLEADKPPGCKPAWDDWRWQLRNSIRNVNELNKVFKFNEDTLQRLKRVVIKYPLSITPYYLSLINRDDLNDPIRIQCVPSYEEEKTYFAAQDDPLGEEKDSVLPGLIHRYPDRVLVTLTNVCPVYCRHCTRKREWCKRKWVRTEVELESIYRYLIQHKEVRDVIISGGEPLILSTEKIEFILKRLREIPHIEIIRIGTRSPVFLPQRIDKHLVATLKKYRPIWVNTHFNHPKEITREANDACDRILCAGLPLNNQSVLLKGVNDNLETMTELCQKLLKIGVRPYYLFQCDPVRGTGHLRTSIEKGLEIIKGMRGFTSGLCIPTFVIDGPDGQGKVPLQTNYVSSYQKDYLTLVGYKGKEFRYYNPG